MSTEAVVQLDGGFDIVGSQISGALEALPIRQLEQVLDQLSNVPFCLKDCELRHVGANAAMAELCGVASRADVLGAGAGAFFDEATSESWEAHDRAVLRTRRPSRQVMAKVVLAQGRHYWLLIGRWPILGDCGELAGIAAIAQRLELSGRKDQTYRRVAEASQLIRGRLDGLIDVGDLAARLSVSVSQLERDFVSVFGVGPRRLFTKWRLNALRRCGACVRLQGPECVLSAVRGDVRHVALEISKQQARVRLAASPIAKRASICTTRSARYMRAACARRLMRDAKDRDCKNVTCETASNN